MVTSGYAQITGGRLYFEVQGTGAPLVLLTDGEENTDPAFDMLSKSFQVIRYDMRGTGKSSNVGENDFSHTTDLLELLDHLSISKVSLVEIAPNSMIALEFAQAFPGRVTSVNSVEALL